MSSRKKNLEVILKSIHVIRRKAMAHHFSEKNANADSKICDFNITPSQWEVMRVVQEKQNKGIKEIAQTLSITPSAATQLVDELVNKGYLVRQESARDRRALSIQLSKEAKQHIQEMKARKMAHFKTLFEALNDEELAQYAQLNQKLADHLSNS